MLWIVVAQSNPPLGVNATKGRNEFVTCGTIRSRYFLNASPAPIPMNMANTSRLIHAYFLE